MNVGDCVIFNQPLNRNRCNLAPHKKKTSADVSFLKKYMILSQNYQRCDPTGSSNVLNICELSRKCVDCNLLILYITTQHTPWAFVVRWFFIYYIVLYTIFIQHKNPARWTYSPKKKIVNRDDTSTIERNIFTRALLSD